MDRTVAIEKIYQNRVSSLGASSRKTLCVLGVLAQAYEGVGRAYINDDGIRNRSFGRADGAFRRYYDASVKSLGPTDPETLNAASQYAAFLVMEAKDTEAEKFALLAYTGKSHPESTLVLRYVADQMATAGRLANAEGVVRKVYQLLKPDSGADTDLSMDVQEDLADIESEEDHFVDAESLYQKLYDERKVGPPDSRYRAEDDLAGKANAILNQGRYVEAETVARLAYNSVAHDLHDMEVAGSEQKVAGRALIVLTKSVLYQGRFDEAQALLGQVHEIDIEHEIILPDMLAESIAELSIRLSRGDYTGAAEYRDREFYFRSVGDDLEAVIGNTIYGKIGEYEGQLDEAEQWLRQGLATGIRLTSSGDPNLVDTRRVLANVLREEQEYGAAASLYGAACPLPSSTSTPDRSAAADVSGYQRSRLAECFRDYATGLWLLSEFGIGSKSGNLKGPSRPGMETSRRIRTLIKRPNVTSDPSLGIFDQIAAPALTSREDAFELSQRGFISAAGDALSQYASHIAARSSGEGAEADEFERQSRRLSELNREYVGIAADPTQAAASRQRELSASIETTEKAVGQLSKTLTQNASLYWDYRFPTPLTAGELQAPDAPGSPEMLHEDEAIVVWSVNPGRDRGLVFAVSKERFAWARLGVDGSCLTQKVAQLRQQIDPEGYQLRGSNEQNAHITEPGCEATQSSRFSRQTAHELYEALLGEAAIQEVIRSKSTLIVVPSGPLTSLPPGLLVVDPPTGDDSDPRALRQTHWLVKDKAITVLPTVSSLKTLRQLLPKYRPEPPSGLLELADPDFQGTGRVPGDGRGVDRSVAIRANDAENNGRSREDALSALPPLPGTRAEGEALRALLKAPSDSLLLGPKASRTELEGRREQLAKVRVLGFATHGLVIGDFNGLTEPALALAHPRPGTDPNLDDGLLRASDAATLDLTADWVVLSACNTASPDASGAEGLSGLARAFFYAGAKSLLVSHWRVGDEAAKRLVTETFRLELGGRPNFASASAFYGLNANPPHMSKAQALRLAMLELMEDSSADPVIAVPPYQINPSFAYPTAWAPFVVVGEAR